MKVKLLKDHLDNKKGDVIEVDEARANYFELVGLAKKSKGKPELDETIIELEKVSKIDVNGDGVIGDPKEKKTVKPAKEKKSPAGPNAKKK